MVGYTAKPKEMSIYLTVDGKEVAMDLGTLSRAFDIVAQNDSAGKDVFDWDVECSCPDNGVLRDDCARYVVHPGCDMIGHLTRDLMLT